IEMPDTLEGCFVLIVSASSSANKPERSAACVASHYNREYCAFDPAGRISWISIGGRITTDRHADVIIFGPAISVIGTDRDVRSSVCIHVSDEHVVVGVNSDRRVAATGTRWHR